MKPPKEIIKELEAFTEKSRQEAGPLIAQALAEARAKERQASELKTIPKRQRSLCGARTRSGGECQARALHGSERCRLHGGKPSTFTESYRRHLREEAAYLRLLVSVCRSLMH
jgi:hypothetical protein